MKTTVVGLGLIFLLASGCGGDANFGGGYGGPGGGGFGATPGGVKDVGTAREIMANGHVPPADAFLVEGMFAEHDLGLSGAPCADVLCLRGAAGVAPDGEGHPRGWLQVGMSSTIDPTTWTRPPTAFILTVDVSGSMGWEYQGGEYPSAGQLARAWLEALVPLLGPRDRVAIVTYGDDVAVPLALTSGADKTRIAGAIDDLHTDGSTNMEAGLRRAYALAAAAGEEDQTEQTRIILFTDVQPNVGATTATEFQQMVKEGAGRGVAITVLGLGLGVGPEILRAMAGVRGANAFTLFQMGDVQSFMAEEYPWFTTPIAYDLRLAIFARGGFTLNETYGFPRASNAEAATLDVATVFLSRKKGAILVSLAPSGQATATALRADLELSYRKPDGALVSQPIAASAAGLVPDARGQAFTQPATARATALALLVTGMHEAAVLYGQSPSAAQQVMQRTHDRFVADAKALHAPDLDAEVGFSARLLDLITQRVPQATFYDQH